MRYLYYSKSIAVTVVFLLASVACGPQVGGDGRGGDTGSDGDSSEDGGTQGEGSSSEPMTGDADCYEKELRNDGGSQTAVLYEFLDPTDLTGRDDDKTTHDLVIKHDWDQEPQPYGLFLDGVCWDAVRQDAFLSLEERSGSSWVAFSVTYYGLPTSSGVRVIGDAARIRSVDWPWPLPEGAEPEANLSMSISDGYIQADVRGTGGLYWMRLDGNL